MENYIVINGRKAELTEEQLKALGIEVKKESPFDRVNEGDQFYYITYSGKVISTGEVNANSDNVSHKVANYCTDKDLLQQQAYRETLNRLLWRYSMEHDGDKIDWNNSEYKKYSIYYDNRHKEFDTTYFNTIKYLGVVYFHTRETAENAIEEIVKPFMEEHPDFKW